MSGTNISDLDDGAFLELFRTEVEGQCELVARGLLALESGAESARVLRDLMRATHSIKGAARIVNRVPAVKLAHAMEDCLTAVQKQTITLDKKRIDRLLEAADLLALIAGVSEEALPAWEQAHRSTVAALSEFLSSGEETAVLTDPLPNGILENHEEPHAADPHGGLDSDAAIERSVRITPENLNRLVALSGETLLASRWVHEFEGELLRLKRMHSQVGRAVEQLRSSLTETALDDRVSAQVMDLQSAMTRCQHAVAERVAQIDHFDRHLAEVSTRLYDEVLDCRMRPFVEVTPGFARMVRDLSHSLGKRVRFTVRGESTPVDREVLELLKAPLDQLLRNAIDHGIENPDERLRSNKSAEGGLVLEARHSAGMLLVTVTDDGRGIDEEAVRAKVVARGLATVEVAGRMSAGELVAFLFLPGFTMRSSVTEVSGRGVGLDVVQSAIRSAGGKVLLSSHPGRGATFHLELPLTLSVLRALLVEIDGEPYALPLTQVAQVTKLARERIEAHEGHRHFWMGDEYVSVVAAHHVLEQAEPPALSEEISVVTLGQPGSRFGLIVDRFLGERELVVRPLDERLGKVKNVSAAAILPDGSPALILDVEDLIRSIASMSASGHTWDLVERAERVSATPQKRVLVVDDSLTVRELQRKLLNGSGYVVDVAVDGMDGWNAVRTGRYDLVITDIDMPRLDGIELVTLMRRDPRFQSLPIMIVSYKEREEDRQRGLEAGADYYLTKGSFHDDTLLGAVAELLGDAAP